MNNNYKRRGGKAFFPYFGKGPGPSKLGKLNHNKSFILENVSAINPSFWEILVQERLFGKIVCVNNLSVGHFNSSSAPARPFFAAAAPGCPNPAPGCALFTSKCAVPLNVQFAPNH